MESKNTAVGTVIINGGAPKRAELVLRQEMIEYRSNLATKPDLNWEFLDAQGHFHAYGEKDSLPTLKTRIEHVECDGSCGDGEGYDVTHWHCELCDEKIEPHRVPDKYGVAPGLWSAELKVYDLVSSGRVSFRFTSGDSETFGFAETNSSTTEGWGGERIRAVTELAYWSVGHRKIRASAAVGG